MAVVDFILKVVKVLTLSLSLLSKLVSGIQFKMGLLLVSESHRLKMLMLPKTCVELMGILGCVEGNECYIKSFCY